MLLLFWSKDTQQGLTTAKVEAAVICCVCLKIHSGKTTSVDIRHTLEGLPVYNIKYLTLGIVTKIAFSRKPTTAVFHLVVNRHHVHFATWEVVQQLS